MRLPKFFYYFIAILLLFIFFVKPTTSFAQSTPTTPIDTESTHVRTQVLLIELSSALICQLAGIDLLDPVNGCVGFDFQTRELTYAPQKTDDEKIGGLLGLMASGIGTLYTPPVSSSEHIRYLSNHFGVAKTAIAQEDGSGFQGLSPIQNIHLKIRDLSYLLLVIFFVVIGIAIMLRLKIDPRTVMTLQNQLPKIVVTIVLIAFSYPLAGLLVDGMWTLTYFGINTLGDISQEQCESPGTSTITEVASKNLLNNPMAYTRDLFSDAGCLGKFDGLSGLSRKIGMAVGDVLSAAIFEGIGLSANDVGQACKDKWAGFIPRIWDGDCIKQGAFDLISFIIGVVAILIVLFAMIIALVRLWFTLIKAYIYILLDVITAPIQILLGLLPNGSFGFERWIRHISAYLLLFPATAATLTFATIMASNESLNNPNPATTFLPPFIGNPNLSNNLGSLIAFGIILITPELLDFIKDALKVKNSDRATKAVTGGFARGIAPAAALGAFGKDLFGYDKNGHPKIGTIMAARAGSRLGVTGEGAMEGGKLGIPYRMFRRTRQKQEELRHEHEQHSFGYRIKNARDIATQAQYNALKEHGDVQKAQEEYNKTYSQIIGTKYTPSSSTPAATPPSPNKKPGGIFRRNK